MPHINQKKRPAVAVREVVNDFLASAEVKRLSVRTQEEYRYNLIQFADWCASNSLVQNQRDKSWNVVKVREKYDAIALHRINAQAVHLFLDHIKATHRPSKAGKTELSDHTLAQYVKDIKRLLNWCLMDDLYADHIQPSTLVRIQKPAIEEIILEIFTEEDLDALFRACEKEESEHLRLRDKAILSLLLDTGIRATELCKLTIDHVYLDAKDAHVRIYGKGRKWGEVGFGEKTRRLLTKYMRQFREPFLEEQLHKEKYFGKMPEAAQRRRKVAAIQEGAFFLNRAGKPITKSGLYQIVERLGAWAGLQGVRCSPHTFRHTFSVMFMRNGGDIYTLSKLLRHSSVKVTENYLKALRQAEARRGAKSVLDSM